MPKLARGFIAALFTLTGLAFGQANASTVVEAETGGGALVKIEVPDEWNGDLVIYNHGFALDAIVPEPPSLGPLAALQLSQGYAVAASSYRQNGWALFKTSADLKNLMKVFRKNFGEPEEILVHGFSLGGIVTGQAIENRKLGNIVGAYPACGAMSGSRSWDGGLDLRLIYDVICSDVPGARIPGSARGLPARFTEYPFGQADLGLALQACFAIFSPPEARPAAEAARLQRFLDVTQLPESWIAVDMGFATLALSDLTFDPTKLNGKKGLTNIGVTYNDAEVDANIKRASARPAKQKKLARNYEMKGKVGDVKIISTHTSGDGLVIVENQQVLADLIPEDQLTVAIANEGDMNTHCEFTEAELVGGWEALRSWVDDGPQPSVADIQDACVVAEGGGAQGPCRYDPDFVVPNMDGRVPPR